MLPCKTRLARVEGIASLHTEHFVQTDREQELDKHLETLVQNGDELTEEQLDKVRRLLLRFSSTFPDLIFAQKPWNLPPSTLMMLVETNWLIWGAGWLIGGAGWSIWGALYITFTSLAKAVSGPDLA